MKILGIETSCDETSAAVLEINKNKSSLKILSNVVSSSVDFHAKTGGIIPEVAAREQLKVMVPVLKQALADAKLNIDKPQIDAIAVTYGPGLIGSLLVGVESAKTLSYIWKLPLIPVNHLYGHIYANFIMQNNNEIKFPAICLIVSGGHTDLVLLKKHGDIQWLGGTRDDAAGEAFDKIGRLLNLPYPAGATIEKLAKLGDIKRFNFPRPMIGSKDLDFSFSGLKAAVLREVKSIGKIDQQTTNDICAGVQSSIVKVLVRKTLKAAEKYQAKSILLGGGVAANQTLRESFEQELKIARLAEASAKRENCKLKIELFVPSKILCTDNGAMIAAAAFYNYHEVSYKTLEANPELYFD